jgi:methionyl aminopeptidase
MSVPAKLVGMAVELKTLAELQKMAVAGQLVAKTLAEIRRASVPGVSLLELDHLACRAIADAGGRATFLDYLPRFATTAYPATICASVNDVIVHGIPDGYRLREGDLVGIDLAAHVDGFCADAAVSFVVGDSGGPAQQLIDTAWDALSAAIAAAQPGGRLGDVSATVGRIGRRAGYGIPIGFGGHGIGREMHEDPSVPNTGLAGSGLELRPGMALAIEPMFMAGGDDRYTLDRDGWALHTIDGSLAAHVEHTVAITESGPVVLTVEDGASLSQDPNAM